MTDPIPDDPEKIAEITLGQRMHDREGDDSELIVTEIRRTSARMKYVEELGQTVAEANPDYPAHEPVVEAVFVSDVQDALGTNWIDDDIFEMSHDDELEPAGIKSYIYPVERLAPVEEAEEER